LKQQLQILDENWRKVDFITLQHKDKGDCFILVEIDDIF